MKKLSGCIALSILLFICACKKDCETNNTGSVTFTNPDNGFNPDSIYIYMGASNLGLIRLLGDLTVNSLPVGKRELTFKYLNDTIYQDSIDILQCMTTSYSIDWNPVSDKHLKQNIQPLNNVLAALLNLNTYTFEYNREEFPNYSLPKGTQTGFMAQDLQKDFPGTVVPFRDGYYAVNYTAMIPVLTKAIQEQQQEIDELKKDIADLKKMLSTQHTAMN